MKPIEDLNTLLNHTNITTVAKVSMNESENNQSLPRVVFTQTGIEYDELQTNSITNFEDFNGIYSFDISVKARSLKEATLIMDIVGNTMMTEASDFDYEFESQELIFDEEDDTNEIILSINTRKQ